MKLYIFRHAQKEADFSMDPDLTVGGHAQAERLLEKVLKKELPTPTQLWVSPKKRTYSTFKVVGECLNLPLQIQEALHEQQGSEALQDFHIRIENLLKVASVPSNEIIFMCTHHDWLVEALKLIPADTDFTDNRFFHWASGQHIGFEVGADGIFNFIELSNIETARKTGIW